MKARPPEPDESTLEIEQTAGEKDGKAKEEAGERAPEDMPADDAKAGMADAEEDTQESPPDDVNTRAEAEEANKEAESAKAEAAQARELLERVQDEAAQTQEELESAKAEAAQAKEELEKAKEEAERSTQKEIKLSASHAQEAAKAGIPRQMALYAEWQSSSARADARAELLPYGVLALVCLLGAAPLATLTLTGDLRVAVGASVGGGVLLAGIGAITWGVNRYARKLAQYLQILERAATEARSRKTGVDGDLDELLRLNRTQMQAYQTLSRGQQRSSFRSSLIALFIGLFVLVGGIAVVINVQADTAKIAVAAVTALGSALSSYIASTYLKLHEQAANQLRYFSDQPIVTSYIYEAERLVGRLSADRRGKTYETVIKQVLAITRRAQDDAFGAQAQASASSAGQDGGQRRGFRRRRKEAKPTT